MRDRLRYQYVQAEIQRYARMGYTMEPVEEYLKKPVEPVGRFAEEGALDEKDRQSGQVIRRI